MRVRLCASPQGDVRRVGLEPTAPRLVVGYSIPLSYRRLRRRMACTPCGVRSYCTLDNSSFTISIAFDAPMFVRRYLVPFLVPLLSTYWGM